MEMPRGCYVPLEKRHQIICGLRLLQLLYENRMEYQKLINLLKNKTDQTFKFRTKNARW